MYRPSLSVHMKEIACFFVGWLDIKSYANLLKEDANLIKWELDAKRILFC